MESREIVINKAAKKLTLDVQNMANYKHLYSEIQVKNIIFRVLKIRRLVKSLIFTLRRNSQHQLR